MDHDSSPPSAKGAGTGGSGGGVLFMSNGVIDAV